MFSPQDRKSSNQNSFRLFDNKRLKLFVCVCVLKIAVAITNAAPIPNIDNPTCFFTNLASRLLSTELNVNLTQIEIYPTNQYTPAVHRLLQVTANIYDAMTNRSYDASGFPLPTIFQPIFGVFSNGTDTEVYITNCFVETI